jgi:hypothetical protein
MEARSSGSEFNRSGATSAACRAGAIGVAASWNTKTREDYVGWGPSLFLETAPMDCLFRRYGALRDRWDTMLPLIPVDHDIVDEDAPSRSFVVGTAARDHQKKPAKHQTSSAIQRASTPTAKTTKATMNRLARAGRGASAKSVIFRIPYGW